MKVLSPILSLIGYLAMAGAIVATAYVANSYIPLAKQYLTLKAQSDCEAAYRLQYFDEKTNTTVSRPIQDLYDKCVEEKK